MPFGEKMENPEEEPVSVRCGDCYEYMERLTEVPGLTRCVGDQRAHHLRESLDLFLVLRRRLVYRLAFVIFILERLG